MAVCPAARIKPPGAWQSLPRPYIVHFPVTVDPQRTGDGLAMRIWTDYQVSVFADSYSSGRELSRGVTDGLDGTHSVAGDGVTYLFERQNYFYDDEFNVHHFALSFRVVEKL